MNDRTMATPGDDYERDPFYPLSIEASGEVKTISGSFSIDQAAQILIDRLEQFDFELWDDRERADERSYFEICDAFDDLMSILSCVAQINLYQARLLWCLNAPEAAGLPRMLDKASEAQEMAYQGHLRAMRALSGDAVTEYVLSNGAELMEWEQVRHHFIDRGSVHIARLAAAA